MTSNQGLPGVEERLGKWDNVKLVLIFLVVLGHLGKRYMSDSGGIGRMVYFIYLFHMPCFVFVSGLFSKRTVNQKRWDKITSFVVMFYFMKILNYMVNYLAGKKPGFSMFNEYGIAWYMLSMSFFMLITIGVRKYSFRMIMALSILLGCLVGYDKSVGSFLTLSRVVTFYPFFFLGYYLDIEKLTNFLRKKAVIIVSAIWMVAVIGIVYQYYDKLQWSYASFLKGKGSFETQFAHCVWPELVNYAWLVRLAYYLFIIITVIAALALIPSVKCIVTHLGSRTLQVYALHETCMYIVLTVLGGGTWLIAMNPKVRFVVITILALAITLVLSTKYLSPFFHLLAGNGKKKE